MSLVSVIIPAYNRAHLISETIDSVLAQTYDELEVIVIDDGSTDNLDKVIKNYSPYVSYMYQVNTGQAGARNTGIRAAKGTYIAFLDSDDLWLPDKVSRQVSLLERPGSQKWIYCDVELFKSETGSRICNYSRLVRPHKGYIAKDLLYGCFISSPSPIIHRDIFEEVGYFNEADIMRGVEDWEMWLRIAIRYPVNYVPEVLARYRLHSNNISQVENQLARYQKFLFVVENAVTTAPTVYSAYRNRAVAIQHVRAAKTLMLTGKMVEARGFLFLAMRESPCFWSSYLLWLLTQSGKLFIFSLSRLKQYYRFLLSSLSK